jgi:hypothetical protein
MNIYQKNTFDILKGFNKITDNNYFNSISHHLFITPFIMDLSIFNNLNIKYIESMINVIEKNIDRLDSLLPKIINYLKKIINFIIILNSI